MTDSKVCVCVCVCARGGGVGGREREGRRGKCETYGVCMFLNQEYLQTKTSVAYSIQIMVFITVQMKISKQASFSNIRNTLQQNSAIKTT